MNRSNSQSGSAFWIILIAIMMFAGLSYAVMQGRSGSVTAMTDDQARAAAAEVISYGDALAKTFQTLKLRGCANNQFNVSNTAWTLHDGTTMVHPANENASAVAGCGIFNAAEGKLQAKIMPANTIYHWPAIGPGNSGKGTGRIILLPIPQVGDTTKEEVLYRMPFVREDVCKKINDIMGVTNPNGRPPVITTSSLSVNYAGTFYDSWATFTDPSGAVSGKTGFCSSTDLNSPWLFSYLKVLIVR